ncbi:hypothetical protein NQ314_000383 [Rhamnusium bicolor]|uniref:Uncharacterized protein n=1 Tax=Rhamnusium bicolor TaxID=1586634 RepID=A0AAV8ZU99_9CUCU|nr:hypothetical protein NQ314_000383 [Rhamnusium bicolor]
MDKQGTTDLPQTQVNYNGQTFYQGTHTQEQVSHNQGQGRYNAEHGSGYGQGTHQTHGVYNNVQRPQSQGQAQGTYNHGQNIYSNQGFGNYIPVTPKPTQVTNNPRGQIGIVDRPVYTQINQENKRQNTDDQNLQRIDYVDVFDPDEQKNFAFRSTTPRSLEKSWPPPFPSTDLNADYVFEYDDGEPVTLKPENVFYADKKKKTVCVKGDFHCTANTCVSKTMVCDGHRVSQPKK